MRDPQTRPLAMMQVDREDWAMVVPALVIPALGLAAVDVVWDLKISCN
jgi:hypothetical protein